MQRRRNPGIMTVSCRGQNGPLRSIFDGVTGHSFGSAAAAKRSLATVSLGGRVQPLTIVLATRQQGNHTNYFRELLRVTVRVNPGAMQRYVRP
jgi:hypothetical protein